ncbi:hypothetical protein C6366_16070 [Desulfonatronum sp. SC1]|nr:hypothetical protein C6366_16070 [Desulfonatronum sp. SC1]
MMSEQSEPPFYPRAILLTVITQTLPVLGIALYFLISGNNNFHWLIPAMLGVALVGMKFAAPRIPWFQLALALGAVFVTSSALDLLALKVSPLFFLAGNVSIPVICVLGFGRYWVSCGYIPRWSNWWPR